MLVFLISHLYWLQKGCKKKKKNLLIYIHYFLLLLVASMNGLLKLPIMSLQRDSLEDFSYTSLGNMYRIVDLLLIVVLFIIVLDHILGVPPKYKGIFQIPGYPIIGNYFQVQNNAALKFIQWANKYNKSIFQIRLGNKRIIIVNSFETVKQIWGRYSTSVNSRPVQYTFHDVISATQGFTIGTTPFGPSFKNKKKVLSLLVNEHNIGSHFNTLEKETQYMIQKVISTNRELWGQPSTNFYLRYGMRDIDLLEYAQMFALRSSISITYGVTLDCYRKHNELAKKIISIENKIIRFRSPVGDWKNFFSFLRPFGFLGSDQEDIRNTRDEYMKILMDSHDEGQRRGCKKTQQSLVAKIRSNKTAIINENELKSICLTMVSAGLDNTPLNFNHLMGHLSQPEYGYKYQNRAYREILSKNNNNLKQAWENVCFRMDCPFVIALIKETLRYFTVLPLSLPRTTTKDFEYGSLSIPKGTVLIMNAFAANHDPQKFKDPYSFLPERWLDENSELLAKSSINHFSFGFGSRMCSGNILAFKELYILICRFIILFNIKEPNNKSLKMKLDPFENNKYPSATSFEPYHFSVRLIPRTQPGSDDLYNDIMK